MGQHLVVETPTHANLIHANSETLSAAVDTFVARVHRQAAIMDESIAFHSHVAEVVDRPDMKRVVV